MKLTLDQKLKMPFDPKVISWRVGATNAKKNNGKATKGIALAYVDARDVMKRLDDVCGMDWQDRYTHVTDKIVVCEIGIKVDGEWLWRSNGAGDTQVEAEKGSLSDAFKRTAVMWGISRYLYQIPTIWTDVNQYKQIENPPAMPSWATPQGYMSALEKRGNNDAK